MHTISLKYHFSFFLFLLISSVEFDDTFSVPSVLFALLFSIFSSKKENNYDSLLYSIGLYYNHSSLTHKVNNKIIQKYYR
jgi:hypothetical protein